jgi:hypothetical protein
MEAALVVLMMGGGFGLIFFIAQWSRKRNNERWMAASQRLKLQFEPATGFGRPRMWGTYRGHPVTLDIRVYGSGKSQKTYTRAEVNLSSELPRGLAVSNEHFFSGVGKFFGSQDIQVGKPALDDAFVIKGDNEHEVRALFASAGLLHPLQKLCNQRGGVSGNAAWVEIFGFIHDANKMSLMLDQVVDVAQAFDKALGAPPPPTLVPEDTHVPVERTPPPEIPRQPAPPIPSTRTATSPPPLRPASRSAPAKPPEDPLQRLAERMLMRRERLEILETLTDPRSLQIEVTTVEDTREADGKSLVGTVGKVTVEVRYPPDRGHEIEGMTRGDQVGLTARCTGWEDFRRRAVFEIC